MQIHERNKDLESKGYALYGTARGVGGKQNLGITIYNAKDRFSAVSGGP